MNLGKPCKYSIKLVNVPAGLVVHLLRAVEDVDHHAEGSAKIFCRFRLSGSGRSGRRSAHDQMQRLRQGDVAAIGERGDHKPEAIWKYCYASS